METQGAYDGQALGEVQSQLPPLEYVGSGQAEEVAGTRVVHVQRRAVEIARPSRPRAHVPALVDEGEVIWVFASRLCVEMEAWFSRKRRDKDRDHGRQQGEEGGIRQVLPMPPCFAERRLVRKGT